MEKNSHDKNDRAKPSSSKSVKIQRKRTRLYEPPEETSAFEIDSPFEKPRTLRALIKNKTGRANDLIKDHVILSMGVGTIPFPLVDLVGISGFQLRLLRKLSQLYEINFKENIGKSFIASLTGGMGSLWATGGFLSIAKFIPGVGLIFGSTALSLFAGASTYALGKVFVMHFESGGTFLDFQPEKVKKFYRQKFGQSKEILQKKEAFNETFNKTDETKL